MDGQLGSNMYKRIGRKEAVANGKWGVRKSEAEHFKISVGRSRDGTMGNSLTSLQTDVRQ